MENEQRASWGSKIGFILSTAGFSVGIGNIWRFPFLMGKYGAIFLVTYLLIVFLFGIILFSGELSIGRAGQANASQVFRNITGNDKTKWSIVGGMGLSVVGTICCYATCVVGWALAYAFKSIAGTYAGLGAEELGQFFGGFIGSYESILWSLIVSVFLAVVVSQGLKKGVEAINKILMPGLFIILGILLIRAFTLPNVSEGLAYYFRPDFSKVSGQMFLDALGQVFYSIGIGMGVGLVYGSYLKKDTSIPGDAAKIALIDTGVAFFAGLVIIPSAMSFGIDPGVGPALAFISMPNVFNNMPLGMLVGTGFFVMLFIAGSTSMLAGLEAITNWVTEHFEINRKRAVWLIQGVFFIVSVIITLNFGPWSSFTLFGKDILSFLDFIASNILTPTGALLLSIFIIYVWGFDKFKEEANAGTPGIINVQGWWKPILQFAAPVFILIILITGLGIF